MTSSSCCIYWSLFYFLKITILPVLAHGSQNELLNFGLFWRLQGGMVLVFFLFTFFHFLLYSFNSTRCILLSKMSYNSRGSLAHESQKLRSPTPSLINAFHICWAIQNPRGKYGTWHVGLKCVPHHYCPHSLTNDWTKAPNACSPFQINFSVLISFWYSFITLT